jgi:hypothetical protein
MYVVIFRGSRDSSTGIATSHGLDARGSNPGKGKSFLHNVQIGSWALRPPIQWVLEAPFPEVKRQGREADKSPQSSSEVKNGGVIPLPPYAFVA